jgi:small GTP-binding protein
MADVQRMKVKVCLVGEGAVGKTALIRRFIHDQFDDRYISTLGAKVSKKEITVKNPKGDGEIAIDMTIWDIMGEKGFRELLKEAYFHGAQGVLAVCDITRKDTLNELHDWIAAVHKVTGQIPIQFLANKADLVKQAAMTEDDMKKVADVHKSPFLYTSAKNGQNVEAGFQGLATMIAAKSAK